MITKEREEEANFALKYQNIPRTETLRLPTWEEVCGDDNYSFTYLYCINEFLFSVKIYRFVSTFDVCCSHGRFIRDYKFKKIFNLTTKDDYLKTCDIVKKLFIGEKVEE